MLIANKTNDKSKPTQEIEHFKIILKNGEPSLLCDFCKNEDIDQSKDKNIFTCFCIKN